MNALNKLDERSEKRFSDLNDRLGKIENRIWWFLGGISTLAAILTVIAILTRILDLKISVG